MAGGPLVHALTFPDATSAPGTPASGETVLYVESGVVKVKDAAGTVFPLNLIAGAAVAVTGNTLDVGVDGSTIEVSSDALRLKDGGVTSAKIADGTIVDADINGSAAIAVSKTALVAGNGLGLSTNTLAVNVDDTGIEINTDTLRLKDGGVTSAKIADGTIVNGDINASAAIALSKLATDPLARANHTGTQTASTISDLAAVVKAYRLDEFAAPTAPVGLGSQKITSLADPTSGQDAATKAYVDSVAAGFDPKASVRVAVTSNVTISNPGTAVFDGVTLTPGDRVLLAGQSTGSQNGLYAFNGSGSAMTRTADADTSAEVTGGLYVWVNEGTANADTAWALTTDDPITLGTTALVFTQVSGLGQVTAGSALTKTGNTLDVAVDGSTIEVNADALRLKAGGITNSHINASAAIATSKLALVAGAALVLTGDTLDVGVDGSTIEVNSDALRLKAGGILNSHVNASAAIDVSKTALVAGAGLGLSTNTLAVNVDDSSIEINADTLRIKAGGVTNAMLADVDLQQIAALTSAANKVPYATGAQTWALADFTAAGRALVDDTDASAQLTTLGVSAFIKTLLDDADAAAARTTLEAAKVSWGTSPPSSPNTGDYWLDTN